jgi:GAF domain-containing protein
VSKDLGVGTTQAPWSSINAGSTMGYKYDQISLVPFKDSLQPEILSELLKGKSIQYKPIGEKSINRLIAPILIRDELIGVIGYDKDDMDQDWQRDEIIMLEMVSTQMGLVLENNRLFAAAQLRLKREQLLGEMTSHIRETLDLDTVLKTAVRELRQAFNLDEVEVRLGAPQDGSITINGGSR